ncbi:Lrp/AsnC family transcriptional regulator [Candidatus Woesearchaeota archaeon]|nr:Lrp/AsnC family transcriptional regulator [Candidatus Woesearchaeota archaeon]MBW3005960.1 Lrp/AsnC family transcriptional regulator [Candidatus Woesearchaeota archaeon]
MICQKDLEIIAHLRHNARKSLVDISEITNIPKSTVFDKMKLFHEDIIKKYTTIVDFPRIGFNLRVFMLLKAVDENKLKDFLMSHKNVNSVFHVNNGYTFLVDCIFRNSKELFYFKQELEKQKTSQKQFFSIIDEIKREDFLSFIK